MVDFQEFCKHLPFGLLIVNYKGEIIYKSQICENLLNNSDPNIKHIQDILPDSSIIKVIKEGKFDISPYKLKEEMYLIQIALEPGKLGGILFIPEGVIQDIINASPRVLELKHELESIMNLSGELVTISDSNGIILRVNNACEQIVGVKEHDLIGKSVYEMEKSGVITSSSTKYVLEKKQKVTMKQTTKSGRRLMVDGYPIFNNDGSLNKVINISKDVTEISILKKRLEETKNLLDYYQKELYVFQKSEQEIVYQSKAMEKLYDLACRIADVDATIFLHGETGVGKEVLARTIHNLSNRKDAPFIKVNCGAIPESIMESELFGYSKGTFTGGHKEGKKGLALAAHKGTLFLDEIGELPLNLQAKLLQLLQEKQFTPLGSTSPVQVDVRFITATNRNLEEMVREGSFREDLYYRLYVIPIAVPSLAERKEDIPFLINYFAEKYSHKYNHYKTFHPEVIQLFVDHKWKGNVRELQNTVERLILTVPSSQIEMHHLPDKLINTKTKVRGNMNLKQAMEQFEKQILIQTLETSATMREASKKLGVDASTITRKVKKYGINIAKLQFLL
ncbi:sigma-54 interaction domain-containing protein [Gottfriedia solisilvae]|uniref:HTH-type transcriptional regulatory protein TyrR n=1 Tax=Gottfriedia solisilvae TaxID=1516104 RepID=A0A8J3APT9_9BACI|nr:sigma 54-interacting transcriptional regulator [Gottfriedia solisilvae]GGI17903.1 RNA polymerase subunit sigma-54 [Gottfriedia solisilvae]